MSRSKNLTITLGSLAAGAVLATSITGIAMAADSSPSPSSSSSQNLQNPLSGRAPESRPLLQMLRRMLVPVPSRPPVRRS